MSYLPGYAFKVNFPSPIWLVGPPPHDPTRDGESDDDLRSSHWDVVFEDQTSSGIRVVGYRLGVFRFDFSSDHPASEPPMRRDSLNVITWQLKYMNCFALCLHSALISVGRVNHGFFAVSMTDLLGLHAGLDDHKSNEPPHATRDQVEGTFATSSIPSTASISSATQEVLEAAFELFESCDTKGGDVIPLASLLNQAAHLGRNGDSSVCVVLAWTVAEKLLNLVWHRYIDAQVTEQTGTSPSKKRMEKYNGRDYTASVVTEILALVGAIPASLQIKLDAIRKARNAWVHSINEPTPEIATQSVELGYEMFKQVHNIQFAVGGAGTITVITDPRRARRKDAF